MNHGFCSALAVAALKTRCALYSQITIGLKAFMQLVQICGARQWSLLKFLAEEMVALAATVAVYAGSWSPLEILKIAVLVKAFLVPAQLLKVAIVGKQAVRGILDNCNYMERRLMRLQYSHGESTRQLAQDMDEFEEATSFRLRL